MEGTEAWGKGGTKGDKTGIQTRTQSPIAACSGGRKNAEAKIQLNKRNAEDKGGSGKKGGS